MTPLDPIVEALACRLDQAMRGAFEERAGIMQFEAGRPREVAEPLALLDVVRMHPLALAGVACVKARVGTAHWFVIAGDAAHGKATLAALGGTGAAAVTLPMALAHLGGAALLTGLTRAPEN